MKTLKTHLLAAVCSVTLLFLASLASAASLLPEGLVITDSFEPGTGESIGQVLLAQGRVVVIHAGVSDKGYQAKKGLYLYNGDTIVTLDRGRVRYQLNDESVMTMASNTKLVLSRSVYEPGVSRSAFLKMDIGKARFTVKKFIKMQRSEFRVKSPSAVVGVRGSEWDQEVTPTATEVITHQDTTLEVVSVTAPDVEPTVLEDFERTMIMAGELPTDVESVDPAEIEGLDREFDMTGAEEDAVPQDEAAGEDEDDGAGDDESAGEDEDAGSDDDAAVVEDEDTEAENGVEETVEVEEVDEDAGTGSNGIIVPAREVVAPALLSKTDVRRVFDAARIEFDAGAGTSGADGGNGTLDYVENETREEFLRPILDVARETPGFPKLPE